MKKPKVKRLLFEIQTEIRKLDGELNNTFLSEKERKEKLKRIKECRKEAA